jgi:GxxExxY protein
MQSSAIQQRTADELGRIVIDAAMRVHTQLGPGLLESTYEACMAHELVKASVRFERQRELPVLYDGVRLDCGYRIDLLIESCLIVELKAVEALDRIHTVQVLTYLKLTRLTLGLLINFNTVHLREGIKRVVNGHGRS